MKKEKIIQLILFIIIFISELVFGYYIKSPSTPILHFYIPIVTSFFAAGSAVLIFRNLIHFKTPIFVSLIIVLLYALNPYIFLFGASGITEMIFIFMIIWSIESLTRFMEDGQYQHLLKIAFALFLCSLTRYEAISFTIGIIVAIIILIFTEKKEIDGIELNLKETLQRIEGICILVLTPIVFTIIIWIGLKYIIKGNLFYFFNSVYSDLGQYRCFSNNLNISKTDGAPFLMAIFIIKKSIYFLIPFLLITMNRIIHKTLLKKDFVILIILMFFLYITQFGLLLKHLSPGWLRYYVFSIPLYVAWMPYEMKNKNKIWQITGNFAIFALSVCLMLQLLPF